MIFQNVKIIGDTDQFAPLYGNTISLDTSPMLPNVIIYQDALGPSFKFSVATSYEGYTFCLLNLSASGIYISLASGQNGTKSGGPSIAGGTGKMFIAHIEYGTNYLFWYPL